MPDAEVRADRQAERHKEEVQWLSYKFERYREDGTDPARHPASAEYRCRELPVPVDHRHGIQSAQGPIEFRRCARPRSRVNLDKSISADNLNAHDRSAFERLRDTQIWFNGNDIYYQKVLGYGASNLALHYKYGTGMGAKDFVLKVGLENPIEDHRIRKEAIMLRKVRHSQHVIQERNPRTIGKERLECARLRPSSDDSSSPADSSGDESAPSDVEPEPKPKRKRLDRNDIRNRKRRIRNRIGAYDRDVEQKHNAANNDPDPSNNRDYLLLEYMENGDLQQLIWRLNEQKQTCPNRVLWSFWVCLIRACIAMAYPVHRFNRRRARVESGHEGSLSEVVPANKTKRTWMRSMVHFAIDPSNILIGRIPTDIDHDEHEDGIVPVLKLAGFGQAEITKEQKTNWYYERRRTCGRHGYYAPEQFLETWDKIEANATGSDVAKQNIAGSYGPAMNIWGIAMTMVALITRCDPLTPPRVAKVKLLARRGDKSTKWWNHYTYGAMLVREKDVKWDYADEELRETLAKCLARDPAHRPDLEFLLNQALGKCQDEGPYVYADGEKPATRQYVTGWMNNMLNNAQPGQQSGP